MLTLEKYHGSGSRHTCPACGRAKRFTRYIDTDTGCYLADTAGRCDRQSSCGYHLKPKEYFADNPHLREGNGWTPQNLRKPKNRGILTPGSNRKSGLERNYEGRFNPKRSDYIESAVLIRTLTNYGRNAFVQFLLRLFPNDPGDVWQAAKEYSIGTSKDGKTIFWQVDQNQKIRTGKIIAYSSNTGKRLNGVKPNWTHSELKKANLLKSNFELQQCFFGEHLLAKYPALPVAIVEAEKSAFIASICKGVFPDMVWLASGGKSNLNADRLAHLGRNRKIILYPDADGFDKWQSIASEARSKGLTVKVSDLIEKQATDAERANGADLADYLIREQTAINEHNGQTPGELETILQERIAIMIFDGGLSEAEAVQIANAEVATSWN